MSASDRTRHAFTVGDHPRLEVEIAAGDVRVRVGQPGNVVVTVEASDAAQIEVSHVGDTVVVRKPRGWGTKRRHVIINVEVPAGIDLDISTVSGEIRLEGSYGNARVHTISAEVAIDTIRRAEVDSTSGDVQLRATGALDVSSISGDVRVGLVQGRLRASLTSGTLRVDRVEGDADVASMSGNVVIGRCDGDDVALRSVSGDLQLGLPTGIRVEPEITTVSGRTSLPSAAAPAPATSAPRRRVRLRMRSVSGDIRIERV